MNKKVIKANKEAFDWWLEGGEVLYHIQVVKDAEWSPISNTNQWTQDTKYVINDEYVEFRKALAEGKTVQYRYRIKDNKSDWCEWTSQTKFCESLDMYRIKPDEPKFKVGTKVIVSSNHDSWEDTISRIEDGKYFFSDGMSHVSISRQDDQLKEIPKFKVGQWVRHLQPYDEIFLVTEEWLNNSQTWKEHSLDDFEPWKPKEGDVVICWHTKRKIKLIDKLDMRGGGLMLLDYEVMLYEFDNVIPYVGQKFEEML